MVVATIQVVAESEEHLRELLASAIEWRVQGPGIMEGGMEMVGEQLYCQLCDGELERAGEIWIGVVQCRKCGTLYVEHTVYAGLERVQ